MSKSDEIEFSVQAIRDLLEGTTTEHMDNQTPCEQWKTSDLISHLVGGATWLGAALRGDAPPMPDGDMPSSFGDDPVGAWDAAVAAFKDGVDSPGAMEREIPMPMGALPGAVLYEYLKFDVLVHAWDLAQATGQEFDPGPQIMDPALAAAHQLLQPEMRDGDRFAAESPAPEGASQIEQLAAFSGRTVG